MLYSHTDPDDLSNSNPEPASPELLSAPWNSKAFYPQPPGSTVERGWGYTVGKDPYGCSLEHLRSYIARDRSKNIKLVWTPQSSHMLPPEEVPELLGDVRERDLLYVRHQLRQYLLSSALWMALALFNMSTSGGRASVPLIAYFILPLALGIIPAAQYAWALRRMRTHEFTWEEALNAGQEVRYQDWLKRHRAPLTLALIAALLLVGLVQIYTSLQHMFRPILEFGVSRTWSAIDAAGLVKSAVWEGEVWRLFTGSVMHGGLWHFFFNAAALYAFGKVVEVLVGWVYLPIVFFFSALAGAVLSLLLVPATSVGSSGGIMGIIGFLAVLGYYNRASLPPGFLKSILSTLALIALFGLAAFVIIDNAAHAGGAICGALLGYLLLPHRSTTLPQKPGRIETALAVLCTLGILASVLGGIIAMFTWR